MKAYRDDIDRFIKLFISMALLLIVFLPLGVWKAIEIIYWVFENVSIVLR